VQLEGDKIGRERKREEAGGEKKNIQNFRKK
jgi:hypothetical protein